LLDYHYTEFFSKKLPKSTQIFKDFFEIYLLYYKKQTKIILFQEGEM